MNKSTINRRNPFIKKSRYYNSADDRPESLLFQTIPSFLSSLYFRKKRQPENKYEWIDLQKPLPISSEPAITWIGHATFLVQIGSINILTDPIFGSASAFFPRLLPPGIALADLPRIDYVILSHNHRDHCDLASLSALKKAFPYMVLLVPKGDKQWLENKGLAPVIEHDWWQSYTHETHDGLVSLTFLPAHHWSAQGIFDRNKSLWGSWMIHFLGTNTQNDSLRQPYTIYFAGDTAYSDHFNHIQQEFGMINAALLPIAPTEPHPWMRKSHMDAGQAVQAFIDLKAHHFIPMHWGTFPFGLDTFAGPLERLEQAWCAHQLDKKMLKIAKVGQRMMF